MDYAKLFGSIPNSQGGITAGPNQNMSSMFQPTPTEQKIKELAQVPAKPKAYTKQELFTKMDKAVAQGYTPEEAYTELLKSAKSKGYVIEGVDIDSELGIQEPTQPQEEKGILGKLADFGQSIKPFTATDTSGMDTSTIGGAMKKSFFETIVDPLKSLANVPGDAIQIVGQLGEAITHPIQTAKSINDIGQGISDNIVYGILNKITGSEVDATDNAIIVQGITESLGKLAKDPERMKQLLVENPVDVALTVQGGLQAVRSKITNPTLGKAVDNMIEATNPINMLKAEGTIAGKAIGKVAKVPYEVAKTLTAKVSGLQPETLTTLFKNPDIVKSGLTRESVAQTVVGAVDQRIEDVSGLGKEYQNFRTGNVVAKGEDIKNAFLNSTKNIDLKELTTADQGVLDDIAKYIERYTGDITDSNLLSLRQQIDSVKFDPATGNPRKLSPNGTRIYGAIRSSIDDLAGEKLPGLKELDVQYGPEIQELRKMKELIYDRSGNLKDSYIKDISNLLGSGKEMKLERIKKIAPEIENEINALKAMQDIELAKGIKIGTYAQNITLTGGIGTAVATANPLLAIATLLITSPTVISNLVRVAGYSARIVGSIAEKIKSGIRLTSQETNIVSKAIQSQIKNLESNLDAMGTPNGAGIEVIKSK